MPKPVLAIDIDEVLFPFTEKFLKRHNQRNGTNLTLDDIDELFYIEKLWV